MGACGAIVTFDAQTEDALRGLWQAISDAGLPSNMIGMEYPPHMTLLACENFDVEGLRPHLPQFLGEYPPMPVTFSGLGVFDALIPVVYLPVAMSGSLQDFHRAFWRLAEPFVEGANHYYRPDAWFPHVTLNREMPIEQAGAVVDALLRAERPAQGLLVNLVIAAFPDPKSGLVELFKASLGVRL